MLAKPKSQPPGLYHRSIGDIVVTAVNDGIYPSGFDLIAGIDQGACERLAHEAFRALPPALTMNMFLLQFGGHAVLIDTGCGVSMGPTVGKGMQNLAMMGVEPADITSILITHLHPDHINGLIDARGNAVFPNAELVVNAAELQFFDDPKSIDRTPEGEARAFFSGMRTATAPYRDRIRTVTDGPALPGVVAITVPGHTPGHTAWLVESSDDAVLIWGDIVHVPSVQLAVPEAGTVLDIDREQGVATRRRVLDMVAAERIRVAGVHLDFPAFGHIVKSGSGYRFVPSLWTTTV
jgi:glyoxylase-like metal-dependent hydrolase (beta-lactamase superfamily II)